jgi:hypothetical protein
VFVAIASYLLADDEPPADLPAKSIKKGICPKCGKHVGRGLFLHTKKCTGQKDH